MTEPTGSPIALLFMVMVIFLLTCLIGILPWRRRKKNKVSLSKQVEIASIWLFIYSGLGFIGSASNITIQRELSFISVIGIAVAADQLATGIFIIKRSMYALKSLIGAMAFAFFSVIYFLFTSYSDNASNIVVPIVGVIVGLITIACWYSPVLRGIIAIRDLEREKKETNDTDNVIP